ncbi:MAG: ferrochelatase [Anaerolineales bacterium]|nr:ferrochelatase [Anaerolineales bacterium]
MNFSPNGSAQSPTIGVLLANTGTPESPTPAAVRRYLAEFLSDPRVVALPRWLWLPILHGVILRFYPRPSARLYSRIWSDTGFPLLQILLAQASALRRALGERLGDRVRVAAAMRYGKPSMAAALRELRDQGVGRFLVFPLFPQYSETTSASVFDAAFDEFDRWGGAYPVRTIQEYHTHPAYIQALVNSLREHWQQHGQPERLLLSFHGIPERYSRKGDPYADQCHETASQVAGDLGLEAGMWQTCFQSRFGPGAWLQPYSDDVLRKWGRAGVKRVDVLAPGFSADCLESLYEIDVELRKVFVGAGGEEFHYIPALNARQDHIQALAEIIIEGLGDWVDPLGEAIPTASLHITAPPRA